MRQIMRRYLSAVYYLCIYSCIHRYLGIILFTRSEATYSSYKDEIIFSKSLQKSKSDTAAYISNYKTNDVTEIGKKENML